MAVAATAAIIANGLTTVVAKPKLPHDLFHCLKPHYTHT